MDGGLYIHIPLCHSKCTYCDFHSFPATSSVGRYAHQRYIDAIMSEFKLRQNELPDTLKTIYLGGGTPSILNPGEIARIVEALPMQDVEEFTIEANPEDITYQWIEAIKSIGINRVSIGVQSLNNDELALTGRRHTAHDALNALTLLADCGITEVSADLIYGLPGQTIESWEKTLESLLSAPITHLSAYSLMYEPGTRLTAMRDAGRVTPVDEDTENNMYEILVDLTRRAGMEHYEISNFAIPGHRARHNSSYWNLSPYLGLGSGAHSFDGISIRRFNPADSRRYIDTLLKGNIFYDEENESTIDQLNDLIITSLRTSDGLSLDQVSSRFGQTAAKSLLLRSAREIENGNISQTEGQLKIPEHRWMISNTILRNIII